MRRTIIPALLLVCAALAGPAFAKRPIMPEPPQPVDEAWFDVFFGERKVGTAQTSSRNMMYGGCLVRYVADTVSVTTGDEAGPRTVEIRHETWRTQDARFVKLVRTMRFDTEVRTLTAEVKGNKISITQAEGGERQDTELAIPDGVKVYATCDEWSLASWGFKAGTKIEYTVFSPDTMKLETEKIEHVERGKETWNGREVEVFRIKQTRSDEPDNPMMLILLTDFKIIKLTTDDATLIRRAPPIIYRPEPLQDPPDRDTPEDRL